MDFYAAQQSKWKAYLILISFTVDGHLASLKYSTNISAELGYYAKTRQLISQKTTRTKKRKAIAFDDFVSLGKSQQLAAKQLQSRSRSIQTLVEDYIYI